GDDSLILTTDPERAATQLNTAGVDTEPALRPYPYEVLLAQLEQVPRKRAIAATEFLQFCYRPYLWQARVRHFRGRRPTGAGTLTKYSTDSDDHQDAGRDYARPSVLATYNDIRAQEEDDVQKAWIAARLNATYWVGLL